MENNQNQKSRRAFMGTVAAGATAGLTLLSSQLEAKLAPELFSTTDASGMGEEVNEGLKKLGKMKHPVGYDQSQANWWGTIWANVSYMTNAETGTPENELGLMIMLRHHGILYSFKDELIEKYKLGEFLHGTDPKTSAPALRNPIFEPGEGDLPMPVLVGINGLIAKGAKVYACNMAYKVYAGAVASANELNADDVYTEFVENMQPGIQLAPSGVWVLGRLAENGIAYIDASVG